jgi:hypothetical protein
VLHTVPISSSLEYTCLTIPIMNLIIMQLSPVSCYLFLPIPNILPAPSSQHR